MKPSDTKTKSYSHPLAAQVINTAPSLPLKEIRHLDFIGSGFFC